MHKLSLSVVATALLSGSVAWAQTAVPQPSARPSQPAVAKSYGKVPLAFEPNRGQADPRAQFVSHGSDYSLLLQPSQATLVLHREQKAPGLHAPGTTTIAHTSVSMQLAGASPQASVTGERTLPGYVNYISGGDRTKDRTGIPTYAAARVHAPYPGIDLLYYGTDRRLEYDFVVAPAADPTQIKLHFTGAQPVLAADGSLRLQTGHKPQAGDMSFLKPVIYQQKDNQQQPVEGTFAIARNGDVTFHLGPYDHTRQLIIDPIISYASYFGGTGEDEINASALNSANQLYAVGQTKSYDLPVTLGEFQPANIGTTANNNNHGGFITKFSADGTTVLWTTYLGGVGDTFATGVAVNSADQPYIVGYTNACGSNGTSYLTPGEFPFTASAVQSLCNAQLIGFNNYETNGGNYDAYLVKLSSDGKTELYGTPLGGSQNDIADGVVLDAAGKVYIVGETYSTQYLQPGANSRSSPIPNYPGGLGLSNYPTTAGAFYTNTTESRLNSTVQGNGDVLGPQDEQAFLTVLSADLSTIVYSSLLGGPTLGNAGNGTSATNGIAIAVSANGIAYIAGNTSSAHWPVSANALVSKCANAGQSNSTCNLTGWLAAFDPTKTGAASLLFSTYLNGQTAGLDYTGATILPGSDVYALATDSAGNVVATGDTNATDFPTTSGTLQPACFKFGDGNGDTGVCGSDAFVSKISPAGALVFSTFIGPSVKDGSPVSGRGIALDTGNNIYLLVSTSSSVLPTKNSITGLGGGPDAYLAELSSNASTLLMATYLGAGGGVALNNNSLSLDSNASAYFSGSQSPNTYGGTSFPTTPTAYDKTIQGSDGFVVKIITQQQPSSTTFTATPGGNVSPTQSVTLVAIVTSASTLSPIPAAPTGTVQFFSGTTMLGTGTLTAGKASITGVLPAGTDNITAVYSGDSGFNTSTSAITTVVVSSAVATTTTLAVSPTTATFGQAVTLTSTTLAGTTPVTTGTVTFTAGGVTLGTATVGTNGVATTTVTPAVGTYSVVANFTGTASVTNPTGTAPSLSAGTMLTVGKSTPAVSVTTSTALAPTGGAVTFTAKVTGTTGTPTGAVNFVNGTTILGTGTLTAGVATFTSTTLAAGSYTVSAAYLGDTSFAAATSTASAVLTVRAPAATTTTLTSSALTTTIKSAITLTAAVATTATTGAPTGTVTFYSGTAVLGTATLTNNTATLTTSTLVAGTQSLTATYSGDTLFLTSTSTPITETITVPSLAITASPNPLIIQHGHSGVLNLTLTPSGGFAATVTFACGNLPQYISCVFAPTSLVFTAASSAPQTDTLTIYTNQAQTAHLENVTHPNLSSLAMLLWLPGSALALFGLRRNKRMRPLLLLVLLACGLGASAALSGCSNNNTGFNTATPGAYTVPLTITGSDGSTQTINASITVQ